MTVPRILVAGIGNIFFGDDGFGVETVRRLASRQVPEGVDVVDFGIRGLDLTYALLDPFDAVILVDAASGGGVPGTLYLIAPDGASGESAPLDAHGMNPVKVLATARSMGAAPTPTYLVACEPGPLPTADSDEVVVELSEPVRDAVDRAVGMIESLIDQIRQQRAGKEVMRQ